MFLRQKFLNDYSYLWLASDPTNGREYREILKGAYKTGNKIIGLRNSTLADMFKVIDIPGNSDIINQIYGDKTENEFRVRYINTKQTTISTSIIRLYVFDGYCHMFTKNNDGTIEWRKFRTDDELINEILGLQDEKFNPTTNYLDCPITDTDWLFRFSHIDYSDEWNDQFMIHCKGNGTDLWWQSNLDAYVKSIDAPISDICHDPVSNWTFVVFSDKDDMIYGYSNIGNRINQSGNVLVSKTNADMRIETFNSLTLVGEFHNRFIRLHHDGNGKLVLRIYGNDPHNSMIETWGNVKSDQFINGFTRYDNILFGDSLFNDSQLRFQNLSKNKSMFYVVDVDEVDGCYYGLFMNTVESTKDEPIYTVFRCPESMDDVIQRLPYRVVNPGIFRTSDDLYSLYVVAQSTEGGLQLIELTTPDSDIYVHKVINLNELFGDDSSFLSEVGMMYMGQFKLGKIGYDCLMFSNFGINRLYWKANQDQISIDDKDSLMRVLLNALEKNVIYPHMIQFHDGNPFYANVATKVNQFDVDFSVFELIPTEFGETQDVGVVPNSKIDDTDDGTDHRIDSVLASTDVLDVDGMTLGTDLNPGFITAAVSSPSLMYEDDQTYPKSQRNPSIEGTEFYDFVYDQEGNILMDLYSIPFMFRIHSNNTYDLYINVPTTRTKYMNRISGSLNPDLTSQVLSDDTRTRLNMMNEALPNNLDESTTKLRIYIDRKFVSVGNVELVEISGNSIPLQIYRDSVNDGLYDSIALESRWNGEVVEINEPSKDINKVMLEFECYGTDSQSIHISGKTLINSYLDDNKYKFN